MHLPDYLHDPASKPSPSRMYDYFLGGFHNFEIDRDAAEQVKRLFPDVVHCTHAARAFLRRTVVFLVQQGIDQFLDIGSGIPTAGNVHNVVQLLNPHARIVYVDNDPLAVLQSSEMLHGDDHACAVYGDARQPEQILQHPDVERMLDWSRPVAVLMGAMLHFIPDDAVAYASVGTIRDAMCAGSYLMISHSTTEGLPRRSLRKPNASIAAQPMRQSCAQR